MIQRLLPATVGAVGLGILAPIVYLLAMGEEPPGGTAGIVSLAALGVVVGGFLGWRFSKVFYWLLEGLLSW